MSRSVPPGLVASNVHLGEFAPNAVNCWISFGGNVGDVKATFDAALALLSLHRQIQLGRRSGLYCTAPMGAAAGSSFLNSVCGLTTTLLPRDLLNVLQSVENQLGRVHDIRWGPRTLDLDLLSYGDHLLDEPDLIVPHPSLTYRRFVLDPLVEVDSNWPHPLYPVTVGEHLARLKKRPFCLSLIHQVDQPIEAILEKLGKKFPEVHVVNHVKTSDGPVSIQTTGTVLSGCGTIIDLRRSPGDLLEKLTSAMTAVFDAPVRVSDW